MRKLAVREPVEFAHKPDVGERAAFQASETLLSQSSSCMPVCCAAMADADIAEAYTGALTGTMGRWPDPSPLSALPATAFRFELQSGQDAGLRIPWQAHTEHFSQVR